CFAAERSLAEHGEDDGLRCAHCRPSIPFDEVKEKQRFLEHMGAHILYDLSIDRASQPCGLCLQPSPACRIFLKKGRGKDAALSVDMKRSACPNLIKFSYGSASQSSDSAPCSNHPIHCDLCPSSAPAVWPYNWEHHHQHEHPNAPVLAPDEDPSHLEPFERQKLKQIWDSR
ncbi:hypothetical protein PENSPDRAFT_550723, partial [Peniophora sp. CONT]